MSEITRRIDHLDWNALSDELDAHGVAVTDARVLSDDECEAIRAGFDDDLAFRSTVVMARHGYGDGVYRYYRYPLPDVVAELRAAAYPHLAGVANRWAQWTGGERHPGSLDQLLARCEDAGQKRPTPLVLRYGAGGHNALHQDRYGDVAFPLQLAVALSAPGDDFTGGESVFVEQRPRQQSIATVATVPRGHAVVFANDARPVRGARGWRTAHLRHGVSTVRSGTRMALGVIFHDAA